MPVHVAHQMISHESGSVPPTRQTESAAGAPLLLSAAGFEQLVQAFTTALGPPKAQPPASPQHLAAVAASRYASSPPPPPVLP